MATPFECEATSEVPDAVACRARWVERFQRANETAEQDAVFTLDAVVIHEGRLANLAVLRANRRADASGQAEVIEELLDTVSRARSTADPTELSGKHGPVRRQGDGPGRQAAGHRSAAAAGQAVASRRPAPAASRPDTQQSERE